MPPLLGFVAKEALYAALLDEHAARRASARCTRSCSRSPCVANAFLLAAALQARRSACSSAPARGGHGERTASRRCSGCRPPCSRSARSRSACSSRGRCERARCVRGSSSAADAQLARLARARALGAARCCRSLDARARRRALRARATRVDALQRAARRAAVGAGASGSGARRRRSRFAEAYSTRWQNGSLRWYLAGDGARSRPRSAASRSQRRRPLARATSPSASRTCRGTASRSARLLAGRRRSRRCAPTRGSPRRSRSTTIGFLVAMLFVVYRSPDILLTQILIETVSTIFVLLVLVFLPAVPHATTCRPRCAPRERRHRRRRSGWRCSRCCCCCAMTPGLRETRQHLVRPGGLAVARARRGRAAHNAVNVIIVDIRAMDTNGEITVLVVVGLCIYGLLRARTDGARVTQRVADPARRSRASRCRSRCCSSRARSSSRATTSRAAASSPACCSPRPGAMYLLAFGTRARGARPVVAHRRWSGSSSRCSTGTVPLLRGEAYMDNDLILPLSATYHLPTRDVLRPRRRC